MLPELFGRLEAEDVAEVVASATISTTIRRVHSCHQCVVHMQGVIKQRATWMRTSKLPPQPRWAAESLLNLAKRLEAKVMLVALPTFTFGLSAYLSAHTEECCVQLFRLGSGPVPVSVG